MRVSYVISDEETRNFDSTLYSYQRVVHVPHPLGGPVGEAVPIDSLVITRNGNQLKTIEDYAEKHLTYTGASDFYDGMTSNNEYSYNANGALVKDLNRKIGYIGYDNLGNIRNISFHTANANSIEYIYAADGTKLRTIHRPASSSALTDSIDYIGNLILKNGQPSMYIFDGGYASFDANGAADGWHYYIQDYMGNNRMVVNKNGTVEQVTHYYPYGGVIGDISTNESLQKYKFEGKELDRTFGLDNYDIHARQYFAMMPSWDRIDPLAEKYYGISPYSYCGGDPINWMDYDGEYIYSVDPITGEIDKTGEFDDYDEIQIVGSNSTMRIEHVNGKSILEGIEGNGEGTTTSVESSSSQLLDAFFFLADNTEYEWSMQVGNKSGKDLFVLGTSRKEGSVESGKIASRHGIMNNTWLNMHSHPDEIDGTPGGSVGDMGNFQLSYKNESEAPLHIVYHNGIAHLYNGNHSSLSGWEKKRSDFELRTYRFWHNRQKRIPKSDGTKTTYINM